MKTLRMKCSFDFKLILPTKERVMKNPELVIMAAGMGSRYGGLKQIDSVDEQGHIIIDFSIYDAIKAGFRDVTFIIKKEQRISRLC